ncbi:MAG: ferritin family protein [Chloroflexia bacterium]
MHGEIDQALQALHQGIQTELQGKAFYAKAAARTADEMGRHAFQSLMREEEQHLKLLKAQYGSLVQENRWLQLEEARALEPGKEVETIFPTDDETLAALLPEEADDLQALEIALDFERKGYTTYRQNAVASSVPEARALYEFLAAQEQRHFEFIQRAHEYLKTRGAWYYDERELPMFEG